MGVGQSITAENANWTFGDKVPDTFVDHIKQSVPLYEMGHELICQVSDFFIRNGFSGEEIVEKSRSLKNVLEPFSTQDNLDLLGRAGFKDVTSIQKYICFEGFLAVK